MRLPREPRISPMFPTRRGDSKRGKSLFPALKEFVDSLLCFFLPAAKTSNICRRYGRQVHSCHHRDIHRVCEQVNGEKGSGLLNLTTSQGLESESGKNQEPRTKKTRRRDPRSPPHYCVCNSLQIAPRYVGPLHRPGVICQ